MTDLENAKPCPFCGSDDLRVAAWCDDAIECEECKAAAPADQWNNRAADGDYNWLEW